MLVLLFVRLRCEKSKVSTHANGGCLLTHANGGCLLVWVVIVGEIRGLVRCLDVGFANVDLRRFSTRRISGYVALARKSAAARSFINNLIALTALEVDINFPVV